jgi:hypothetical protein
MSQIVREILITDIGASDGNRTRTTCLGSRSSAIELRSRGHLDDTDQS